MAIAKWDESLRTGHALVDRQHQGLLHSLQKLHDAIEARGDEWEAREQALEHLSRYVVEHFALEERLMSETGYPEIDAHRKKHDDLTRETGRFVAGYQYGRLVMAQDLLRFMAAWVHDHIQSEDQKMVRWVRSRNAGTKAA